MHSTVFCFLLHIAAQLVERKTGDLRIAIVRDSHQRSHCVVFSTKTLYPLLSTGLTQKDKKLSRHE